MSHPETIALVRCATPGVGSVALAAVGPLALLAGIPMVVHAVRTVTAAAGIDATQVLVPPADLAAVGTALAEHRLLRRVAVVPAGAGPAALASVVARLEVSTRTVVLHDAVRPLAPVDLVDAVVAGLVDGVDAVVPTLPVADTVKLVDDTGSVIGTVPRDHLRMTQTPQAFRRAALAEAAQAMASGEFTDAYDETEALERLGRRVVTVAGHDEAFAVHNAADVGLAEAIARRRRISREG